MLEYDPSSRVTLKEAKRHQFFQSLHNKAEDEAEEAALALAASLAKNNVNGNSSLMAHGSKSSDPIVIDESSCDSEKATVGANSDSSKR